MCHNLEAHLNFFFTLCRGALTVTFLCCHHLQTRFRVLPGEEYKLLYNFFPLVAGQVALPRLHVNMLRYPGTMDDLIYSMLPSHIFIRVRMCTGVL